MKYVFLLITIFFMSCSEITLLRTKEIRSVESNLKMQIDSLKYVVDSLSQVQISMSRRMQADLKMILTSLIEGNDKLQMRLEENQYALEKLAVSEESAPKIKLSPALQKQVQSNPNASVDSTTSNEATQAVGFDPELEKLYSDARTFFNNKQYKESFLAFKGVYEKDPIGTYAENALYWMANSYDQTGQGQNAITVLDRLLLEFPGGAKKCQALFEKGRLLGDLKKVSEQKAIWQSLIDDTACAGSNEAFRASDLIGKLK